MPKSVISVVGARPNFMKIAPILRAFEAETDIRSTLVHTGQHYDKQLSDQFFSDLEIPRPDINLDVGSGPHGAQTGEIMRRLETHLMERSADMMLVLGDVNSTLAGALVASKLHIPVAHVEAGLRSFDRRMPEEINRVVTDVLSELHFVTEEAGVTHLRAEGISPDGIFLVGDVMIDTVLHMLPLARKRAAERRTRLLEKSYLIVTLHRPSNVDREEQLTSIVDALVELAHELTVLFPVHPRTKSRLRKFGLESRLSGAPKMELLPPLGYLEFLGLLEGATGVLTDSGGIQAEATYLQVPCLTLRDTTERPATVEGGANRLLGSDPSIIGSTVQALLEGRWPKANIPELMDGQAATRIVKIIDERI